MKIKFYTEENTKELFGLIEALKGVKQDPKWHLEGDALQHTLQVFYIAIKETNDVDLLWACLLHDVGKAITSKKHDFHSTIMIQHLASPKTIAIVKEHMRIKKYLEGQMKRPFKCEQIVNNPYFKELIMISRYDNLGRNPNVKKTYNKQEILDILNQKVPKHFSQGWTAQKYKKTRKKEDIVVMAGNIGAGKSTYVKKLQKEGYVVVARDQIRYAIGGGVYIFNPKYEPIIRKLEIKMLHEFLKLEVKVVIDGVGVSKAMRREYIKIAKEYNYKIKAIEMPRLSKKESVNRRMQDPHQCSDRTVWEGVWDNFDKQYQSPTKKEGFDEVIRLGRT